ncbi:sensor histidine kinase [Amycolatopsis anabasis]|uniref:sensor histidine kinase n=1 Tax=Amycolatopsis anabasis TaxID=1840409 RepID=UPI00131B71EF|nr:sensor histidine kinase [Amycolatopsis anabasis]
MNSAAPDRRRIGKTDLALTAALLAAELATAGLAPSSWFEGRPLDPLGVALLAATVLPVLLRRLRPMLALALCAAASIAYHAVDYPHEVTLPAAMVLLYTVAVTGSWQRLLVTVLPMFLLISLVIGLTQEGPPGAEVAAPLGWLAVAAVFGAAVRSHRAYVGSITERAERAEHTREEEAARRVAEERLRIARDLHDALAHTIVVINAHAGVAAHLLGERPDDPALARVAEPLRTIAAASSTALAELRTTLDVLRGNDSEPDRQPTPGIDRLPELAESTRAAGIEVAVRVLGEPRELGQGAEITLYRIAQEALTNVVKHAGATAATVLLEHTPGEVRLEITDNGRGPATRSGGGYGIIGMTERAHALGGGLTAGPGRDGGFTVTAILPIRKREGT